MINFDAWWNSAAADEFRSKHEDMDGNEVRPIWDAALRASAAPSLSAVALNIISDIERHIDLGVFITETHMHIKSKMDELRLVVSALENPAPGAPGQEAAAVQAVDAKDAARWRRLVNASEMPFPILALADDPENDCLMVYGRKRLEERVDECDLIPDTYDALPPSGAGEKTS